MDTNKFRELAAKWRKQAESGRALHKSHPQHAIDPTTVYVFEACADELESLLAAQQRHNAITADLLLETNTGLGCPLDTNPTEDERDPWEIFADALNQRLGCTPPVQGAGTLRKLTAKQVLNALCLYATPMQFGLESAQGVADELNRYLAYDAGQGR